MSNTTLLEISQMQDQAWINGDVHCIVDVQQPKMSKAGRPFYPIKLTDPDDASAPVIDTTVFQDPSKFHGKICVLSGKGNKKTSFNNNPQVAVGKNGFFKIVGEAAPSTPAPVARGVMPVAQAPRPTAPTNAVNTTISARPAFSADGAKTGGCVARAMEAIAHSGVEVTEDDIVLYAGMFLRATSRLEKGEWAQQAAQPVKRPQAGPNGQVNVDESDFDEANPPPF